MSTSSRVAGAVAAGYVLGRFKKLRLAVIVASAMSNPKVRSAAVGMIQERIPGGAVVGTLTKGVGGKLVDAGKTAATSIVASRIDTLSESLADRSQNLRKGTPDGQSRKSRPDEPGDGRAPEDEAYDEDEADAAEEPEDEYDEDEADAAEEPEDEYDEDEADAEEPEDEYDEDEADAAEEPEDEYDEDEADAAEEPEDEYDEDEADAEEPEDEYDEDEADAEEPEDEGAQATVDDDESPAEEPKEPVARSPRRRRSASPAGRRRS
jgi:hypothetical protein